ncbi:hypothetical protein BDF22DRAFT_741180 [Syncephalis plumigaleata]|nr:hypothetical protein BDF22DRAFT_741180 [Syncephalis plumigaleata]
MGNTVGKREADSIDGGALLSNGIYSESAQDYDHRTVRKLMLERRIAPFYKGLADMEEIESAAILANLCTDGVRIGSNKSNGHQHGHHSRLTKKRSLEGFQRKRSGSLAIERVLFSMSPDHNEHDKPESDSNATTATARLSVSDLYRNAIECPICFLFYPRNINYSRCCHQPICTECFLQIKRNSTDITSPASCPFCVKPNFGVIYTPPTSAEFYLSPSDDEKLDSSRGSSITPVTCDDVRPDLLRRSQRRLVNASLAPLMNEDELGNSHIVSGSHPGRLDTSNHMLNNNDRSSSSSGTSNRHRRSVTTNNTAYLAAMRTMGVDLEEMMVAEAIRLSLLDQANTNTNDTTTTSNDTSNDSISQATITTTSIIRTNEFIKYTRYTRCTSTNPLDNVIETVVEHNNKSNRLSSSRSLSHSSITLDTDDNDNDHQHIATYPTATSSSLLSLEESTSTPSSKLSSSEDNIHHLHHHTSSTSATEKNDIILSNTATTTSPSSSPSSILHQHDD